MCVLTLESCTIFIHIPTLNLKQILSSFFSIRYLIVLFNAIAAAAAPRLYIYIFFFFVLFCR